MNTLAPPLEAQANRIADLEERVAYLERELGLSRDLTRVGSLVAKGWRGNPARIALALAYANGRILSDAQLADALPDRDRADDSNNIKAHMWWVRKMMGYDAVETVRGIGYRMTPKGCAAINPPDQRTVAAQAMVDFVRDNPQLAFKAPPKLTVVGA